MSAIKSAYPHFVVGEYFKWSLEHKKSIAYFVSFKQSPFAPPLKVYRVTGAYSFKYIFPSYFLASLGVILWTTSERLFLPNSGIIFPTPGLPFYGLSTGYKRLFRCLTLLLDLLLFIMFFVLETERLRTNSIPRLC